jgi:hypothetical protein
MKTFQCQTWRYTQKRLDFQSVKSTQIKKKKEKKDKAGDVHTHDNFDTRSRNIRFRGTAISIRYPECVYSLSCPACQAHAPYYIMICGLLLNIYTGCPRRNVPDFGRVFLVLKYTDITQNTYIQSWTVTEIMAREKCGILEGPRTVPVSWQPYLCPSSSVVSYYGNSAGSLPSVSVQSEREVVGTINTRENILHV